MYCLLRLACSTWSIVYSSKFDVKRLKNFFCGWCMVNSSTCQRQTYPVNNTPSGTLGCFPGTNFLSQVLSECERSKSEFLRKFLIINLSANLRECKCYLTVTTVSLKCSSS